MLEFCINSHLKVIILFLQLILQVRKLRPRGVVKFAQSCTWVGWCPASPLGFFIYSSLYLETKGQHLALPSLPPTLVLHSLVVTFQGIIYVKIPQTHNLAEQPLLTSLPLMATWCISVVYLSVSDSELWTLFLSSLTQSFLQSLAPNRCWINICWGIYPGLRLSQTILLLLYQDLQNLECTFFFGRAVRHVGS